MKISFKYILLFFAVGMMTVVACSDDDSDDPAPTPPAGNGNGNGGNGGNGGGNETFEGIFAVVNQDSTDFTTYSAELDDFTAPTVLRINGRDSSGNARINIVLAENYTGTADASKPTSDQTVTFRLNNQQFSPSSGTITVSQNDTVVAGTFSFIGRPLNGTDTLNITDGKFNIPITD